LLRSYVNPQGLYNNITDPFKKTGSPLEVRVLRLETADLDSSKSLLALPQIADVKSKERIDMQL
jgi:hypothetical protein